MDLPCSTTAVDLWSIGCVLAEMLRGLPKMEGRLRGHVDWCTIIVFALCRFWKRLPNRFCSYLRRRPINCQLFPTACLDEVFQPMNCIKDLIKQSLRSNQIRLFARFVDEVRTPSLPRREWCGPIGRNREGQNVGFGVWLEPIHRAIQRKSCKSDIVLCANDSRH